MDSSDEDMPLVPGKMSNGFARNGTSAHTIPKSVDKSMDKSVGIKSVAPGISIRNGPVTPVTNGDSGFLKRKAAQRVTNLKEESDSEEELPKPKRSKASKAILSDSDSDVTLKKSASKKGKKPVSVSKTKFEDSDDDMPLAQLAETKAKIEKDAEVKAKKVRKEESKAKTTPKANGKKRLVDSETEDDKPLKKSGKVKTESAKKGKAKEKTNGTTPSKVKATALKKEKAAKTDEEEDDDKFKWWEAEALGDGTQKWSTLHHSGVLFPPEYERLPKNVKLLYDGKPVTLSLEAEEVATFFGSMLNSTHNVENPVFQKNFFNDFTKVIKETGGAKDKSGDSVAIKEFAKLDFNQIFEHYQAKSAAKKAIPAAEKKALKAIKDAAEEKYMFCLLDGRKEKVGNFRVEPPGLFRGRGEHPKTGKVKKRVLPEQITINIGEGEAIPEPPAGHKWGKVQHDNKVTWLAMWQENINNNFKYVMLAANSSLKGMSDVKKFEKARELQKHIDRIRKDYTKDLRAELMADRQRATAVYLIDKFALRAGNAKGEDEADTVGCCSLKFEHITLKPPNIVIFDFLGKDSIRYYDEVTVDAQVFKNLKIFKKPPKGEGDEIFDRLTTASLNKHLNNYMPGLSAKVFRTYNASWTMSELLKDMKATGNVAEKLKTYNDANRKVAILCNHKRTVTAGHAGQMEKMSGRIKGLKYQRWRLGQQMLQLDSKQKKKRPEGYFSLDDEITEEWIKEHQAFLVEELRQKTEKKFAKDNEKLIENKERPMKDSELKERLKKADELAAKYKKENKSKKVEPEGSSPSVEKIASAIDKINERITVMELQAEDKESNKEVALGTSKINYIDPRLSVVFCKKFDVPIEKIFAKTLREKFAWAIDSVDETWEF